nr:thioredoxin domain-containing protein [Cohnella sp. CFH 77786]
MRILVWASSAVFVALIAVLVIFWPKPGPLTFDYTKSPSIGPADAKVKLMEFGDFKCPTCAYFSQDIMSKIKTEYIDTGKISLNYQNWTIIAQDSYTAALAGLSIYHQSNEEFWKFYDAMFKNQNPNEKELWATPEFLVNFAKQQGLKIDYDKLKKDIEEGTYKDELDAQNAFARKHNFTGTPTVLLNGVKLDNQTALAYDNLKAAIDKALQESEK